MISESSLRESLENFRERYFSNYTLVKFPVLFPLPVFAKYLSEVHTFRFFVISRNLTGFPLTQISVA